jgi:6-phosphogluconolactonase
MTISPDAKLEILANPDELARQVADWLLAKAVKTAGTFAVALSGGTTPRRLYERLAGASYHDTFPWSRTHWFWGDERFVPHDSTQSNYRMVREVLLSCAPIPPANVHAIPVDGFTPELAAISYERELKAFYGRELLDPIRPLFDVTFLGLGLDGHTASLFPGTPTLSERDRWVAAVVGAKSEARITLTYPALESSRHVAFLVSGREKREIFIQLQQKNAELPAARLHPTGSLYLFADNAAAGRQAA